VGAVLGPLSLKIVHHLAVELDRGDPSGHGEKDLGQVAGAGTDFDDAVLGIDFSEADDLATEVGIGQEMLA
jgi:hypothetical protein